MIDNGELSANRETGFAVIFFHPSFYRVRQIS